MAIRVRTTAATGRHLVHSKLLFVVSVSLAGCTSSGVPWFVKFSSDSRAVIFEDWEHPWTFVYIPSTHEKRAFPGRVACADDGWNSIVLLPNRYSDTVNPPNPLPCKLVHFGECISVETLPSLPLKTQSRVLLMDFADGGRLITMSIPGNEKSSDGLAYQLSIGKRTWEPRAFESDAPKMPYWRPSLPGGIYEGRHVYVIPGLGGGSRDVVTRWKGTDHQDELLSPDSRYLITIGDMRDSLRRTTITDQRIETTTVLLDKNDWGSDVLRFLPLIFFWPLLPRC